MTRQLLWQDIQVGRSPTIPWFGLLRNTRVTVLDAHNFPNRRLSVLEGLRSYWKSGVAAALEGRAQPGLSPASHRPVRDQ